MARELDLQGEWQRLYELYHAMSDDDLLEMAERPDDLTDIARDVLGRELRSRNRPFAPVIPDVRMVPPVSTPSGADSDLVWLDTFEDALNARIACEALAEAEIPFIVRDESSPQRGLKSEGGPAVWLAIDVEKSYRERAVSILRERLGRFPLPESESEYEIRSLDLNHFWTSVLPSGLVQAAEMVFPATKREEDEDERTFTPLGYFETLEETQELTQVLAQAGVKYRVADRTDAADLDDEYRFEVQIHAVDLPRATELVEQAMPTDELNK